MTKNIIGLSIVAMAVLVLSNLVGWSFYSLLRDWSGNVLANFGVADPSTQSVVIIVVGMALLFVLFKKGVTEVLD